MMSYLWNLITYPFVFFYNLWRTRGLGDDVRDKKLMKTLKVLT